MNTKAAAKTRGYVPALPRPPDGIFPGGKERRKTPDKQ